MMLTDTWSWTVVWMATFLVHSTLAIGGIWLLTRTGRPARPSVRDVLWKAALVAPVVTASLQLAAGIHPLAGRVDLPLLEDHAAPLTAPVAVAEQPESARGPSVIEYRGPRTHARITMVRDARPGEALPAKVVVPAEPPAAEAGPGWSRVVGPWWPMATVFVWLFVATALLVHLGLRYRALRSLLAPRRLVEDESVIREMLDLRDRGRVRRRIAVSHLASLRSPVAYGHSEICLPSHMVRRGAGPALRTVLGHELAHLERGDYYWLLAASILEEALFFQPLMRLARREMQQTAEFLCDDFAVTHGGRDAGPGLASTLAAIAAQTRSPRPVGLDRLPAMDPGGGLLLARVERLLDDRRIPEGRLPAPKRATLAGGLALALMFVAPAIVAAGPPDDSAEPSTPTPVPAPPTPSAAPEIEVITEDGDQVTTVIVSDDGTTTVEGRKATRSERKRAKRAERKRAKRKRARRRRRGEAIEAAPRVVVVGDGRDIEVIEDNSGEHRTFIVRTPDASRTVWHVAPPAPPTPPSPPHPSAAPPAPPASPVIVVPAPGVPHVAPPPPPASPVPPVPPLTLPPMPDDLTDDAAMRRWEREVETRARAWEEQIEREVRRQVKRQLERERSRRR